MDKNRALKCIRFILDTFEEIDLAYVFGSFLERDDFRDIDVAIHLCKEQSPYERFKLSQRVARDLEKEWNPESISTLGSSITLLPIFNMRLSVKG